jgi:hypothetical protein
MANREPFSPYQADQPGGQQREPGPVGRRGMRPGDPNGHITGPGLAGQDFYGTHGGECKNV